MSHKAGPHFLQIPGPSNVPGRILRAIERPTIDHRGPAFQALACEVLEKVKPIFKTVEPVDWQLILYSSLHGELIFHFEFWFHLLIFD